MGPLPEITDLTSIGCKIEFSSKSIQSIIDELYNAKWVENPRENKRPSKKQPIRVEENVEIDPQTQREIKKKVYWYRDEQPCLNFLEALGLSKDGRWLDLRRDALLRVIRQRYRQRGVYLKRCDNSHAFENTLSELLPRRKKTFAFGDARIPGTLLIGAQERNAEKVKFCGTADLTLLLHFWQVVCLVYVPQIIDKDGKADLEKDSYIFAIPEVSHLTDFIDDFPHVLGELGTETIRYRPAEAVVSIPEEGALDYMRLLLEKARKRVEQSTLGYSISAVEIVHLKKKKKGNNVAMLSSQRLEPDSDMLQDFEHIRRTYKSPLFRAHMIRNLVAGRPCWFTGFADLAAITPAKLLMNHSGAPWVARQLSRDVNKKFRSLQDD